MIGLILFAMTGTKGAEISVRWKPPVVDLRNSVIRAYEVNFTRTDMVIVSRVVHTHVGGSDDEQTLRQHSLKAFRRYNFTVSACSDNMALDCGPPTSQVKMTPEEG